MTAEITVTGPSSVTDEIAAAARRAGIAARDFETICWLLAHGCGNLARVVAFQAVRRADREADQ